MAFGFITGLIKKVGSLIGGPVGVATSFIPSGGSAPTIVPPGLKFPLSIVNGGAPCPPGTPGCPPCEDPRLVPDPRGGGFCVFPRSGQGIALGLAGDFGEAVMGRFGAALQPAVRQSQTLLCPRGSVLGLDDLCYNRRDLKNTERKWPKGRAPLLTGGEMRAISIASRAAGKLTRKQKQLRKMGMLPPLPSARRTKRLMTGTIIKEAGPGSVTVQ